MRPKSIDSLFKKQAEETVQTICGHLAKNPTDLKALWFAGFYTRTYPTAANRLKKHVDRLTVELNALGEAEFKRRLRESGIVTFLANLWEGLVQGHFGEHALPEIAEELAGLSENAEHLGQLAYSPPNWNAHWNSVAKPVAKACHQLIDAALRLDPECKAALALYSDKDFLRRAEVKNPKWGAHAGATSSFDPKAEAEKVRGLIQKYEAGDHPLDLAVRMDSVRVIGSAVVDVLIEGLLHCKEWRGRSACAEALQRVREEQERVVTAMIQVLENDPGCLGPDGRTVELERNLVKESAAEGLKLLGMNSPVALDAIVAAIRQSKEFDAWDNRQYAECLLALLSAQREHSEAKTLLKELVGVTRAATRYDSGTYASFLQEAEKLISD